MSDNDDAPMSEEEIALKLDAEDQAAAQDLSIDERVDRHVRYLYEQRARMRVSIAEKRALADDIDAQIKGMRIVTKQTKAQVKNMKRQAMNYRLESDMVVVQLGCVERMICHLCGGRAALSDCAVQMVAARIAQKAQQEQADPDVVFLAERSEDIAEGTVHVTEYLAPDGARTSAVETAARFTSADDCMTFIAQHKLDGFAVVEHSLSELLEQAGA